MDLLLAVSLQIAFYSSRHDAIHHQPMTEAPVCDTKHLFAEVTALRVHHREGRVVAYGTNVAEMIGKPFQFRHERSQPHGAWRNVDAVRRLDRVGESQRVG